MYPKIYLAPPTLIIVPRQPAQGERIEKSQLVTKLYRMCHIYVSINAGIKPGYFHDSSFSSSGDCCTFTFFEYPIFSCTSLSVDAEQAWDWVLIFWWPDIKYRHLLQIPEQKLTSYWKFLLEVYLKFLYFDGQILNISSSLSKNSTRIESFCWKFVICIVSFYWKFI